MIMRKVARGKLCALFLYPNRGILAVRDEQIPNYHPAIR